MKFEQLLNDLKPHEAAFVVGNGVNLYRDSCYSWQDILVKLCEECKIEISRDDINDNYLGLTYPEIASLIYLHDYQNNKKSTEGFKKGIVDSMRKVESRDIHKSIVSFAQDEERQIPILTLNFDMLLTDKLKKHIVMPDKKFGKKVFKNSSQYTWNYCYNDISLRDAKEKDSFKEIMDGFGVWHMHGSIDNPGAIKFGLLDYVNCIAKAKPLIDDLFKKVRIANSSNKNDAPGIINNWHGRNTWLHHFFTKRLIMFGLSIDSNEIFFRWLLVQKKLYQDAIKDTPGLEQKESIYIHSKRNKQENNEKMISKGKKLFLEECGINVVEVESWKEFYDCFHNIKNP